MMCDEREHRRRDRTLQSTLLHQRQPGPGVAGYPLVIVLRRKLVYRRP
jgi:hypothetical protein